MAGAAAQPGLPAGRQSGSQQTSSASKRVPRKVVARPQRCRQPLRDSPVRAAPLTCNRHCAPRDHVGKHGAPAPPVTAVSPCVGRVVRHAGAAKTRARQRCGRRRGGSRDGGGALPPRLRGLALPLPRPPRLKALQQGACSRRRGGRRRRWCGGRCGRCRRRRRCGRCRRFPLLLASLLPRQLLLLLPGLPLRTAGRCGCRAGLSSSGRRCRCKGCWRAPLPLGRQHLRRCLPALLSRCTTCCCSTCRRLMKVAIIVSADVLHVPPAGRGLRGAEHVRVRWVRMGSRQRRRPP